MGRTAPDTKPIDRRRALSLLGSGLAVAVVGCSGRSTQSIEYEENATVGDLPTPAANASDPSVAIAASARAERHGDSYAADLDALSLRSHEPGVTDDYRGLVIEGIVENTGSVTVRRAEVRARVFDTDGAQLGVYLDSTSDLTAGTRWRFDVVVLEDPETVGSYDIVALGSLG
ncbi:FxLYD domain-containing protein [Halococcus saccharolyticus]|uniref:DUF3426 domain-containing protein n=1 Tax=Halococcus saccharolyticus DSM 5350 TaxID=1227455 RepID=M0MQC2_9EURY|nr:FxLYD domain-containing protein [Halococcus saccharolyticus]EMA46944.1 hypothetical protein C449_02889 [Halococcus saccharolyticus DSM 5350]